MAEPSFIQRLKERKLGQWTLAYLAGAWVVYEATGTAVEVWNIPLWLVQSIHVLLIFGLFVTLILAWYHGEKGRQRASGPELLMVAALFVLAGAALAFLNPRGEGHSPIEVPGDGRPAVAVLPCENWSPDPDDAFFASGIHDEILLRLSKIGALRSIGRESTEWYRDNPVPLRQVAQELGVGFLGECSVLKDQEHNQVRVTFQLLDGNTGTQIWAQSYDEVLTARSILDIHSQVARRVARAIGAVLSPEEEERVRDRPTENSAAYESFLRGEAHRNHGPVETELRRAIEMYRTALQLDTMFALAYARLSEVSQDLWWWFDREDDQWSREAARSAETALRIDPDLPEGHAALAKVYQYRSEPMLARSHLLAALEDMPNNSEILTKLASSEFRIGNWEEAEAYGHLAYDLDPMNQDLAVAQASQRVWVRRYREAEGIYERALALGPQVEQLYVMKARMYISWRGDLGAATEVLKNAPPGVTLGTVLARNVSGAWWFYRALLAGGGLGGEGPTLAEVGQDTAVFFLSKVEVARQADNQSQMAAYADSARIALESRIAAAPNDARLQSEMALALSALGRVDEAVSHANRALELIPLEVEAVEGYDWPAYMAEVLLRSGDHDGAIDHLEVLLSNPGWFSAAWLGIDPIWHPLRDHPRFQALLEEYADNMER